MAQRYEFFVSLHYPAGMKTIRVADTHYNFYILFLFFF